jgi:formate--tetrahydrofolate ligase
VEVYLVHRQHLSVSATAGSALHAEHRTERRFAQRTYSLLADACESERKSDCYGSLSDACLGRCDGCHKDKVEEIDIVKDYCAEIGVGFAENDAYAEGSKGAVDLANLVVDTIEKHPSEPLKLVYDDTDSIEEKIEKVAKNIYGAASISFAAPAKKKLQMIKELGYEHFPICIAKTQFSFSTDAKQYCVASGFDVNVRDIVINAGAEMIVVVAGSIMRMPGLPKVPAAMNIDIVNGEIEGLS